MGQHIYLACAKSRVFAESATFAVATKIGRHFFLENFTGDLARPAIDLAQIWPI